MLRWVQRQWRRVTAVDRSPFAELGPAVASVQGGHLIRWRRVDRLEAARPDDRVFEVDAAAGTVVFGDGVHGRRPAEGELLRVRDEGAGTAGQVGEIRARVIEYEFPYSSLKDPRTPPGPIRQIMPAGGWSLVEALPSGERLTPLSGWALLGPYVPAYREGGRLYPPEEQSVRGLIARAGGPVRIVDESAKEFAGYRFAGPN